MKIGVLLKEVADTESLIEIAPDGKSIIADRIQWVINPYDEIALEEALRLRESLCGPTATASPEACRAVEVVIVTAGLVHAQETMRRALAMGADRGLRIDVEGLLPDPFFTATLLAAACRREGFDIVFAGKISTDAGWGQVHIGVAEMLSLPHVSPVEKFECDPAFKEAVCTRAAGAGVKEMIRVRLPALIGCEKSLNQPRYVSLPGILKAKSKPIAETNASELGVEVKSAMSIERLAPPPERRRGRMIAGRPRDAARELVRLLREEAKVI
ncbi:MAG: electron transfer flavoprotein subunit beta/FixA family protein [bacterium]